MSEINRINHPEFIKYQEFIVSHPNYKGLHYKRKSTGDIVWVATKKTKDGKLRDIWWHKKAEELNIEIKAGFYAKVAVLIHPTGMHTCQVCGKSLQIEYIYPNKRLLAKLEFVFDSIYQPFNKDVFQIIDELVVNQLSLEEMIAIFKTPLQIKTAKRLKEWIYENHTKLSKKSFLSPGVMSNAPDRFVGFHSDCNICRPESDKGRHKENLQRYGQDRRVYENWADGDWKQADRLMSEFRKYGLSADHIGPISLGFCHRPKFHSLTREENSAKNNRMSLNDVRVLIADEKNGEQVVSWHSRYVWDNLKNRVQNDVDAVKLSSFMRINLHHILTIFSIIDENGFRDFLMQFLNLGYSFYDYKFEGFNPKNGTFKKVLKIEKKGKNQDNNTKRYIRIAFESLENYKSKENRKVSIWKDKQVSEQISEMLGFLKAKKNVEAKIELHNILKLLAEDLTRKWGKVSVVD